MLQALNYKCTADLIYKAYDVACLDINSEQNFQLLAYNLECYKCVFVELKPDQKAYLFDTKYDYILEIQNNETACSQTVSFDEYGMYGWNFTGNNCSDIFITKAASKNPYIPLIAAIIFFIIFGCLWYNFKCMLQCLQRRGSVILSYFKRSSNLTTPSVSLPLVVEQAPKREHSNRIKSIDVFRGYCIVMMIFIHYGGGEYWFFRATIWNGIHITDCVYPWFLWIVGFCIKISLRNGIQNSIPRRQIIIQIIKRSIILIVLGIVISPYNRYNKVSELRLLGVLQRLGVCYLIVALLEVSFIKEPSNIDDDTKSSSTISCFEDIKNSWLQWIVVLSLVTLHTLITFLLPVPGCPTGYLGPGGLQNYPHYESCTGGATGYIDRLVFGTHYWKRKNRVYRDTVKFNLYGLLGTLTSVLTVYMGVHAARILHTYDALSNRIVRWVVWSTVTGVIAGLLCNFSKNEGIIPVNSKLWSLSFALALSSLAFLIECVLHVLVDVTRKWGGQPLIYPGMNSILLYASHLIFHGSFPFYWEPEIQSHQNFLIINLFGTCLWVIVSYILYKRNIYLKI